MRVNFWSGAGGGKSTISAAVFHALKSKHYNVELAREVIKSWAYERKTPKSFDQVFLFGSQLHAEDSLLQAGVEHIVTDSPVLMQIFYARKYGFPCWQSLLDIAIAFEATYPSLNIFLDREGLPYQEEGRYENHAQAKANDVEMKAFIQSYVAECKTFRTVDLDKIVEYIEQNIGGVDVPPAKPGLVDRVLKRFLS